MCIETALHRYGYLNEVLDSEVETTTSRHLSCLLCRNFPSLFSTFILSQFKLGVQGFLVKRVRHQADVERDARFVTDSEGESRSGLVRGRAKGTTRRVRRGKGEVHQDQPHSSSQATIETRPKIGVRRGGNVSQQTRNLAQTAFNSEPNSANVPNSSNATNLGFQFQQASQNASVITSKRRIRYKSIAK
ncbi:unnamed protein product [Prunus armeniaca]